LPRQRNLARRCGNSTIMKLIAIVVVLTFAVSCKKDESPTGADAKKTMGLYAKGYNALLSDPQRLVANYFSTFPNGFDAKSHRPSLFDHRSFAEGKIKEARSAFAAGKDAAPESLGKLDAPAQRALVAIDKVLATYTGAMQYYQAESYKDDAGAKAKQLHEQMIAASGDFRGAMRELGDELSALEDVQATDELAKYADDKDYSYWFRFYNQRAKTFLTAWERGPDAEKTLPAAEKALAAANAELAAFTGQKGGKLHGSFRTYADRAIDFLGEAKKLVREGGKGGKDGEALVRAYNQLITMSNTLQQLEGHKVLKDE
jgi:hypothetical protein